MSDETGRFGAYTLEAIAMQGADGIMYRAHHTKTGSKALLKVPPMPDDWDDAARFRERFVAAARSVQALHHPGILDMREVGVDEAIATPYIAYEDVEGKDVAELTSHKRRLPDADIALVGAGVAEALDFAHQAGFVHGNVCPANVIYGPNGVVKLAGFGIRHVSSGSPTDMRGHAGGVSSYVSPEQVTGGKVDGRSDLFALGIVLFELVTGEHPFVPVPPQDVRDCIATQEAPLVSRVRSDAPPAFNSIVSKLLQKDPAKRYQRGNEAAAALRALHARLIAPPPPVAAAAPQAAREPAGTRPAPAGGPSPRMLLLAGAGLVVLVAAVVAVVLLRPIERPAAAVAAAPTGVPRAIVATLDQAEAALDAGDFAKAERLLAAVRREAPVEPRLLDLSQRSRTMREARIKQLFDEGLALGRARRFAEAEERFRSVIAIDPDNVDAKDQIEELRELQATAAAAQQGEPVRRATVAAKPTATPTPVRRLRVYFNSPLPRGELRMMVDRKPLTVIPFDFGGAPAGADGAYGLVQRAVDMPHGFHQVLVTLHNPQGLTVGEHTFVLDFQPGREFQLTITMASPRAAPRFLLGEVR